MGSMMTFAVRAALASAFVLSFVACGASAETESVGETRAAQTAQGGGCAYGPGEIVDGELWCDIGSTGSTGNGTSGGGTEEMGGGGGRAGCPGGRYGYCSGRCYDKYKKCCKGKACEGGGDFWAEDKPSTECREGMWKCTDRCARSC